MLQPGRKYSSGNGYRYGFGGQEKDNENAGQGNSYTAEFWQYDSRIGRRWNIDPVFKEFESPYASFNNNPINIIDPKGLDGNKPGKHTVQSGENLGKIAKRYNTTVGDLLKRNKIKDKDLVLIGQELNVPQFSNPNEIDAKTGIKAEIMKHVDFSGKNIDLGFSPGETNSFNHGSVTSDYELGPGSGYQTIASRINNFFKGTGNTNMVYGPETQFTRSAQENPSVEMARQYFYSKYSKIYDAACKAEVFTSHPKNLDYAESYFVDLARRNQVSVTEFKGTWGVGDAWNTGIRSTNAIGNQYIGSCSINVFASSDANRLIFVVANSTSNWSWKLHAGTNIKRNGEVGGQQNSTILNIMVWDEPLNYERLRGGLIK